MGPFFSWKREGQQGVSACYLRAPLQKGPLQWSLYTGLLGSACPSQATVSSREPASLPVFIARSTEREILIFRFLCLQKEGGDGPSSNTPLLLMRRQRGSCGQKGGGWTRGWFLLQHFRTSCLLLCAENLLKQQEKRSFCKASLKWDIINKHSLIITFKGKQ